SNNVSVLLGNGDGSFQTAVNYAGGSFRIAVADVNSAGNQDLATKDPAVLLGNGDGTFQRALNFGVPTGPYAVVVADFNGDGKQDLATANASNGSVSVLLNNTPPTISSNLPAVTVNEGAQAANSGTFDALGRDKATLT